MPTRGIQYLGLPPKMSMFAGVASSIISLVMCPIYSARPDRLGKRKPLTQIGRVAADRADVSGILGHVAFSVAACSARRADRADALLHDGLRTRLRADAWYMIGCVLISLIAVSLFDETGGKELDDGPLNALVED
jgi:MHS family proline/betaine transporter-like MFS transporter